ncbi:MAG: serine/threonine protein kinase [Muribaculaceae bacterium]|nr:serine/threonine protein kinase [Muribaculaceae bacterium]
MLPVGALLRDTYIVDDYLASGGFGNTYLVHHKVFGDRRAIKEYFLRGMMTRGGDGVSVFVNHLSDMAQVRLCLNGFMDEARRMHQLNNANIVRVHDVFEENNTAYYVMDYINGNTLTQVLKSRNSPLGNNEVRSILDQMLDALDEIHSKGLWHLDIKPSNIMLNNNGRAILIDFGTSKQIDKVTGEQCTSAIAAYTPGYAPGEQQDGSNKNVGAWTDLYSLGATIYHLLTGLTPPTASEIYNDGVMAFRFLQGNDKTLSQLVMWLMNPCIDKRPHSVAEVRAHLKEIEAKNVDNDAAIAQDHPSTPASQQQEPGTVGLMGTDAMRQRRSGTSNNSTMKSILIGLLALVLTLAAVFGVLYMINDTSHQRKHRGGSKKSQRRAKSLPRTIATLLWSIMMMSRLGNPIEKITSTQIGH